jgi:hypothetical protein
MSFIPRRFIPPKYKARRPRAVLRSRGNGQTFAPKNAFE